VKVVKHLTKLIKGKKVECVVRCVCIGDNLLTFEALARDLTCDRQPSIVTEAR